MKRVFLLGFITIILLSACNQDYTYKEETDAKEADAIPFATFKETNDEVENEQDGKEEEVKEKSKDKSEKKAKKKKEVKSLTTEEAAQIVRENLLEIDDALPSYWNDLSEETEDIFAAIEDIRNKDYEQNQIAVELIEHAKKELEDHFAASTLDKMTKRYLVDAHSSMHKDYLIAMDMEARYDLVSQDYDTFQFSFIRLEDEAGMRPAGLFIVDYAYEKGTWKMVDYLYYSTDEQSLQLTFDDLEFYYTRLKEMSEKDDYAPNYNYEPLEIKEIGYDDHLVFNLDGVTVGRNVHTSEIFMP